MYNQFQEQPTSETKWEQMFPNEIIEQDDWQNINKSIYATSIDTTLRKFQYKIVMRILPTNKLLYKFKYVKSNLCDFCNCQTKTIEHLLWECHILQPYGQI